jgi:hypothetical protein
MIGLRSISLACVCCGLYPTAILTGREAPAAPEAPAATKGDSPATAEKKTSPKETRPPRDKRDTPPRITRTERVIEGWRIKIDDRLQTPEHADLLKKAVRLLGDRLYEIAEFLPAERAADLRKVVILVDLDHGRLTAMQYHPSKEWLRENGYDPEMVRCVHVPAVKRMVDLHHQRVQPWCVLHELAHAYHDQYLDFDNAEIAATYEASKASGGYAKALHIQGHETEHYAMTNPKEYFAELSEAYVGTNDFYPFVRGELKKHDPRAYELMEKIWGKLP